MQNDVQPSEKNFSIPMTRDERRQAMPIVTAFVDDITAHFGRPRSIKAEENGHVIEWTDTAA